MQAEWTKRGFTVPEAASYLGCGESKVRELLKSGALKSTRLGVRILIDREQLDALFSKGSA